MTDRVIVEVADHVAEVRLNRGDKHNGLDYAMFTGISDAIDRIAATGGVRAVVLHGDGPSFCAGLDFLAFAAEQRPTDDLFVRRDGEDANLAQRVSYGWQMLPVPVICALQGNVLGGGAQIALGADIRIAHPEMKFSILEIKWGLIPDMGITQSITRLVGVDVAKELTFTGRRLSGAEALELGVVTKLADEPLAAARELAAEIAAKSPDAIRRGKRLYEQTWNAPPAQALALEEKLQRELLMSPNQLAAVQAAMSSEAATFTDPDRGADG